MGIETAIGVDGAGKRKTRRARVLLSAKLDTPFGEVDCRLRDLSSKGALIECRPTPPTGTEVTFIRGEIGAPARVAWSQPGRLGLEFDEPIDDAAVLVQLNPSKAKPVPRYRPAGAKAAFTEQERKRAAAWGRQVGIKLPDEDF